MPKLEKNTLALTFKYDCDRFLRFKLASKSEQQELQFNRYKDDRPGQQLMAIAGRRWEADKYQDLLDVVGTNQIEYRLSPEIDQLIGRQAFESVENVFDILRRLTLPLAIIEGEFSVPTDITPKLQEIYQKYGLDPVKARPDIIWIRKAKTGSPLIGKNTDSVEYELHIIDVKMAAEPSLRHFAEVTFYALSLAKALEKCGLSHRFAVSAEGFIWPGSHDANAFRNLHKEFLAKGEADALTYALLNTLLPVPYEVYQVHVKQFFDERLLKVLEQSPLDTAWHVAAKCQLCSYRDFCVNKAKQQDHLSRITKLNQGQAELIRSRGISTTEQLADSIEQNSTDWQSTLSISHQLKAESKALLARAKALQTNSIELIAGRKCAMMPAWSDLSIFITAHFDPGSGIAFALGASKVYFPPNREKGSAPIKEQQVFIIDRVQKMSADTERARLVEFVQLVSRWLQEAHLENEKIHNERKARGERDSDFGKLSAHIFFWDGLEVKQLKRMFERHMENPQVVDMIELLIRMFPPDSILPDPDMFKSQPGTVVKDVLNMLFGLPIAHDYTLFDVANIFYPSINKAGEPFVYQAPYGFETVMSDQIPYERAYELWEDRIFLRKFDPRFPNKPEFWRKYSRGEVYDALKQTVFTRLNALEHIVGMLRKNHKDLLTLKKPIFSAAASQSSKARLPEQARKLIAFEKLNAACDEIENRQYRFLPAEEREARFISVRGLSLMQNSVAQGLVDELKQAQPKYVSARLLPFAFAETSRDARIKEGDFLWSISNEEPALDLDMPWRLHLDLSFAEARELLAKSEIEPDKVANISLSKLLQVDIVNLETTLQQLYVIISPNRLNLFQFAEKQRLIDLTRPLILDPIYQDFDTRRIEQVFRLIGGSTAKAKKNGR